MQPACTTGLLEFGQATDCLAVPLPASVLHFPCHVHVCRRWRVDRGRGSRSLQAYGPLAFDDHAAAAEEIGRYSQVQ